MLFAKIVQLVLLSGVIDGTGGFGWFESHCYLGMRILAWWHGIDARTHKVRNNECHGCIRFMKAELTAKSSIFCFFDKIIGKKVSKLRDSMLTQDQLDEAKRYAREVSN